MSIASRARYHSGIESRDIKNDRRARAIEHRKPSPSGGWLLTPPTKAKTSDRKDADRRRKNANWYPNPAKPKWLRSGITISYCKMTPMKK